MISKRLPWRAPAAPNISHARAGLEMRDDKGAPPVSSSVFTLDLFTLDPVALKATVALHCALSMGAESGTAVCFFWTRARAPHCSASFAALSLTPCRPCTVTDVSAGHGCRPDARVAPVDKLSPRETLAFPRNGAKTPRRPAPSLWVARDIGALHEQHHRPEVAWSFPPTREANPDSLRHRLFQRWAKKPLTKHLHARKRWQQAREHHL